MINTTVEEQVKIVGNRFALVLITSKRVRELGRGHAPRVPVADWTDRGSIALDEIEQKKINPVVYLLK